MNNELKNTIATLSNGETILYPTDTVWGIGCDATRESSVNKIYKVKQRSESKSLIVLVDSFEMLQEYIEVLPSNIKTILKENKKPTTIIYKFPKGLAQNVIASDHTVAIRIVKDDFCRKLIAEFGKPIVSTSANISGDPTPKSFQEISSSILESVDYIVNLQQNKISDTPSTILMLNTDGSVSVIRK